MSEFTEVDVNGTIHRFPASMSEEEIVAVLRQEYPSEKTVDTALPAPVAEFASAANRGVMGMLDIAPNAINEALALMGSDASIPNVSDLAGRIGVGQEGFMKSGLARDVVQAAGETAPVALGVGSGMRAASQLTQPGSMLRSLAGGTPGQDVAAGLLAGAGAEAGEAGGEYLAGPVGGQVGRMVGGIAAPVAGGMVRMPSRRMSALRNTAPAPRDLKDTAAPLYQQVDDMGVMVKPGPIRQLGQDIQEAMLKKGVDRGVSPKAWGLLRRIQADTRGPMSASQVHTLRKVAGGVANDITPHEAFLGSIAKDKLDDFLSNISVSDMSGRVKNVGGILSRANQLTARAKKTELLETAIAKARDAASGFENGLRVEFRALLKRIDGGRLKGFTKDEINAMRKVVRGTPGANILKILGRLGISENQATNLVGASIGAGLGGVAGGWPAAIAVPAAGTVARKGAQLATLRNAQNASALTAHGPMVQSREVPPSLLQTLNPYVRAGLLSQAEPGN